MAGICRDVLGEIRLFAELLKQLVGKQMNEDTRYQGEGSPEESCLLYLMYRSRCLPLPGLDPRFPEKHSHSHPAPRQFDPTVSAVRLD